MQLFYSQDLSPTDAKFSFSKEESRHIAKVLRKQIGETPYILPMVRETCLAPLFKGVTLSVAW